MLIALSDTVSDLAVGLLLAASVASLLFAAGVFLGLCIHGAQAQDFIPPSEPKDAEDLDDWLGQDGLDFNFRVYREPKASVRMGGTDGLR
jgi:hypothetical protein